jgi:MFS family permease
METSNSLTRDRYQIGQAIGCLVMPPLSESYGRRKPYLYSCTAFAIGNLIAAVVPSTYAGVVVGRFISGLVSAVPTVVIGGSIEDLYEAEARIWLIFAWNTSANAALAIGPIYASYIAASAGW